MSVTSIDRFFEPHWQVQYWDETTRTWLHVQYDYMRLEAASDAAPHVIPTNALRWRLMEIAPGRRTPMEEHRLPSLIFTEDCEHCRCALRWCGHFLLDRDGDQRCTASPTGEHEA